MNVYSFIKRNYENVRVSRLEKNKANSKPIIKQNTEFRPLVRRQNTAVPQLISRKKPFGTIIH